jgi:Protein kinase domain
VDDPQHYPEPGTEIANYRVQSLIARGGTAAVYRALDIQLSRPVALKLLAPVFSARETSRRQFVRESRLAASVDHPNILPIYGAGEWSGLLYVAMRYVHGTDLKAELDRHGTVPLSEARHILGEIAAALDAAHAAGLVHRDVKPGSILLSDEQVDGHRHVYLTDFGLTKRATSATGVTTADHFLGTVDYVAPEQIRGEDVDGQADVYALACVAYTVLAGHPPFNHEDDSARLWAHLVEEPPRLSEERPEVPTAVELAILRGMAKKREDRPSSCGALVALMSEDAAAGGAPRGPDRSGIASAPEGGAPDDEGGDGDAVLATAGQPGDAGSAVGRGSRSGGRGGSRHRVKHPVRGRIRWVVVLGAVLLVVLAAGLLLARLTSGDQRVPFSTEGVPYTLDVPESWTPRTHGAGNSTVSVLSDADLTGFFADDPDATEAVARAAGDDPASVVGLAIYHRPSGLGGQSPDARVGTAEALLPGRDANLVDRGATRVGDLEGQAMEGSMPLADGVALQVRVLVVETDPVQLWVFFAPPSLSPERTEVFDEVAGSLRRTG